jgi:hypothetical protein
MAETQRRRSSRYKIEPLNYAEAALSPALKGMTSFLDVSPENVRNQDFHAFGPQISTAVQTYPVDEVYSGDETPPVVEAVTSLPRSRVVPKSRIVTAITSKRIASVESSPIHDAVTEVETLPPVETLVAIETTPVVEMIPGDETPTGVISFSAFKDDVIPGRGRSKIRRCVLAQDGHSLGEEAIYQVLWRTGKPENGDPNGSRTNRMGAADIGFKVNMAKKNVRQNISRLFEKLALEIVEDFETVSSQARLYRIYSYKQILERRRASGLEYVLRNKGVVFCTSDGMELVTSPAYVSSPGGKTSIKPAPPKKRRSSSAPEPPNYPQTLAAKQGEGISEDADLKLVSQALNRYWSVDQAAAVQLLRACRKVRSDARADEIAFFVQEKLELARTSRTITNPTGLILATVPQSFVGSTFDEFRQRMERRAKLAAEEDQRRKEDQAQLTAWILKDRERYESIVGDPSKSEKERDEAEKWLRDMASWSD